METIQVKKSDFDKILNTAENLINEMEQALSQDQIVKKRINDIKTERIKGKTEKDLDNYLKIRGLKVG